ncbi:SAF domain-containing protein [Saxibacter everestensis]|uniref:SAF domain-containing protein n=1 Tax=Saxibacter everestensis TaxID=2909229 RepID=A0ABY8QUH9_9MICO|nr:SAF domain-containing protein [Brevibacteriaceae bacterium ZFBP1038]
MADILRSVTSRLTSRRFLRYRRLIAALCCGLAATFAVTILTPDTGSVRVLVAAHDIPAGARILASDLSAKLFPPALVPDQSVAEPASVTGRSTSVALPRGTPLTTASLRGPGVLVGTDNDVAMPIRFADGEAASLLSTGQRINLYASAPAGDGLSGETAVIAEDVIVLQGPSNPQPGAFSPDSSAVLTVGVSHEVAKRIAAVSDSAVLRFVVLPD